MRCHKDVAAFILAGGASSRMGRTKGLIRIDGEPLIVRTARLVKPLVSSVTVIGPARPYRRLGLATISDDVPGVLKLAFQGPLTGIVTALGASAARWNLILACDLPYLSAEWIDTLLLRAKRANAQAFLPRTPGGLEPLAAVYRRDAYDILAKAFGDGVRKITDALTRVYTESVAVEDLGDFGDGGRVLNNMNTPEDLAAAQAWRNAHPPRKKTLSTGLQQQASLKRRAPGQNK